MRMPPDTTVTLPAMLPDEELLRRVLDGDTGLFEVIMRRYNQRLYRVVRAILGSANDVEDAMQQAYLNAFVHLDQFADRASFSTWLTKIAVHEALARARSRRPAASVLPIDEMAMDDAASTQPNPEHQAFAGELRRMLESAVDALPQDYRVVFMLRQIEGLSTQETADSLEINEDTVKTRLHRARALLREELYARTGVATVDAFQFHASRCDCVVADVFTRIATAR
jgi:RNA polymerase sigma-70 factor (ECF subfamily)